MGVGITEVSLVGLFSLLSLPEVAAISIMVLARFLQLFQFLAIYLFVTLPLLSSTTELKETCGQA